MSRTACITLLIALAGASCTSLPARDMNPPASNPGEMNSMPEESKMIDLFNRWEQVWHEGKFDLVPSCVAETYVRHDQKGDRTVTRDAYAAEIANIRKERPDIRVVVYDHSFSADRAWFRFAFKWTDAKTGEAQSQAGMQAYRIADGKLAETWLTLLPLGSAWPDTVAQKHWTSPPPIK
jgi:SnoaL-like domain